MENSNMDFSHNNKDLIVKSKSEIKQKSSNGSFIGEHKVGSTPNSTRGPSVSRIPLKCGDNALLTSKSIGPAVTLRALSKTHSKLGMKEPNELNKNAPKHGPMKTENHSTSNNSNITKNTTYTNTNKIPRSSIMKRIDAKKNDNTTSTKGNRRYAHNSSMVGDFEYGALTARERVFEKNKLKVFEGLEKKLEELQSEFINKYENLKLSCPDKLKTHYKFITMIRNDECKLIVSPDDNTKMPKNYPTDSISDFKTETMQIMSDFFTIFMDNLKDIETMVSQSTQTLKLQNLNEQLEKHQKMKIEQIDQLLKKFCSLNFENEPQSGKVQKEMQDLKKSLSAAKRKIHELTKEHDERIQKIETDLREMYHVENNKKELQINELQKKIKNMERLSEELKLKCNARTESNPDENLQIIQLTEQIKCYQQNTAKLNARLMEAEEQLLFEKIEKANDKLNSNLSESDICSIPPNAANQLLDEKNKEISKLNKIIAELETERANINKEMINLKKQCDTLNERLKEANNLVCELEAKTNDTNELSKMQMEFAKLRQSDIEKRREIEKLKIELSKLKHTKDYLTEQMERDRHLLDVRSELINSLQQNDASQSIHISELYAQVSDKSTSINELNKELRVKTDDFQNLFSTLTNTQMELSHQQRMVKLLNESNERSQMLRVRQEEKISRMEEEIGMLKQRITTLQSNNIQVTQCTEISENKSTQCIIDNIDVNQYRNERPRKRQVNINVKKYEA